MGSFVFKWEHPADEVYVTGTFDNWTKSVKLERVGDVFQKQVTMPETSDKIYYKFVVDNSWVPNESAPQETDSSGNLNNVLLPSDIIHPRAAIMSTVGPESTTAALAGAVPLEKEKETKAEEAASDVVPGGFPETPADEMDRTVSVNPLPAADFAVNPIKLAPGEPLPAFAEGDVNKHVKLDKESYEKSDALPGLDSLPPVSNNMIPESSLPITSATITTLAPGATTADLAGQVPLEAKVPDVVRESQEKAGIEPEASAQPDEVKEKAAVENELKDKVEPAPSAAEGTSGVGTEKKETTAPSEAATVGIVAGAAAAGGAVIASVVAAKDSVVNQAATAATAAKEALPASLQSAIAGQSEPAEQKAKEISPEVPAEVKNSIAEAGKDPEAAANTLAVEAKKEIETELLEQHKAAEAKLDEVKPEVAQPVEAVSKTTEDATKAVDEAFKPAQDVVKPIELPSSAAAPATAAAPAAAPAAASNGAASTADSKPVEAAAGGETAATEGDAPYKKKHRISVMFDRLKSRFGSH